MIPQYFTGKRHTYHTKRDMDICPQVPEDLITIDMCKRYVYMYNVILKRHLGICWVFDLDRTNHLMLYENEETFC
jgi:hypothetical protein